MLLLRCCGSENAFRKSDTERSDAMHRSFVQDGYSSCATSFGVGPSMRRDSAQARSGRKQDGCKAIPAAVLCRWFAGYRIFRWSSGSASRRLLWSRRPKPIPRTVRLAAVQISQKSVVLHFFLVVSMRGTAAQAVSSQDPWRFLRPGFTRCSLPARLCDCRAAQVAGYQ